jgi:hypothetical protein
MRKGRHHFVAAAALLALAVAGRPAGAQEVERLEVRLAVTGSNVAGIAQGQVIRFDAEQPTTKLAFPTLERVSLFDTTLDIRSSFFVVRGRVGSSSIAGIAANATLECRFNFATGTCSVIVASSDDLPQFAGDVLRLRAVED